ncbi:hypothetical protein KP509_24G052500 [Ceratopteris richardii]|uniref:Uncharacterized protein n=1 Tax=Ceratopteris richardii TaxID=49495 RepID=A0A8T2RXP3_CERRI|nr:hypothetical protein KP509_24G052500 [Ceratopteris richardii]KAH7300238.1 hypothetical protein KP509_24G052500 [Ceratopteris richardii]KAH7300239.1 hypothetical protein KP509_24G052500 [Ceratopteris richardii]KAH7300240.1 hypothetical protein KP509_24G052500 [Ceratopteris richardii]
MGGGTVFRGVVARLMGAAAASAAVTQRTEAFCHVQPPPSDFSKDQDDIFPMLMQSQEDIFEIEDDIEEFTSQSILQFEQQGSTPEKTERSSEPGLRQAIFSTLPTEEEVEEATNELHAALNISFVTEVLDPQESLSDSVVDFPSHEDVVDATPTPSYEREMVTSSHSLTQVGKFAVEAFQLIQTNSRVQDAVKSLARDPAVWNAVMSNEKVLELTQDEVGVIEDSDLELIDEDASATTLALKLCGFVANSTKAYYKAYYNYLTGMFLSVLQNMFGSMEKTLLAKGTSSTKDKTVASCMMLAVAVVIVVVVRRSFRMH